jgi:RNA-binding protein 39
MGKGSEPGSRVYVGNIHINLSETDVRQVFDPFGPVENVSLHPAVEGRSGGYAFVQYRSSEDARKAVQQMNGFELGGRQLKVSYVTSEKGQMSNMAPSSQSLSIDEGGVWNFVWLFSWLDASGSHF